MRSTRPAADGPEVLIIGGGFAGLSALQALAGSGARVTLVDRNVYSTFQPLLYQVATAGLTSADVAYPLWTADRHGAVPASARASWPASTSTRRIATLAAGEQLSYDYLIIATGVSAAFFGVAGAAEHSLSLYTRRDAVALRNTLMDALERRNEGLTDPELDVTVVGGGATGVELAGTLAELRNVALPAVYPQIDRSMFRVRLIEMGPALLAPYKDSAAPVHPPAAGRPRRRGAAQHRDQGGQGRVGAARRRQRAPQRHHGLGGGRLRARDRLDGRTAARQGRPDRGRAPTCGSSGRSGSSRPVISPSTRRGRWPQLAQPAIQQGRHAGEQVVRLIAGQPTQPVQLSRQGHHGDDRPPVGRRASCAVACGCAARWPGWPGSGCT